MVWIGRILVRKERSIGGRELVDDAPAPTILPSTRKNGRPLTDASRRYRSWRSMLPVSFVSAKPRRGQPVEADPGSDCRIREKRREGAVEIGNRSTNRASVITHS